MTQTNTGSESTVLMITILNRGNGKKIADLFSGRGVRLNFLALGKGTADSKILSYWGLGETEKDVLFSVMPGETAESFVEELNEKIGRPGSGIAMTIPINGAAGCREETLCHTVLQKTGGSFMDQSFEHALIVAIANQGFSDEVMDAAKAAKATGGTVIHARGASVKDAEKFFGITIQPEKELILILTKNEHREEIMRAIAREKGLHTDAKAIAFSLPVNGVAGLPAL